MQITLGQQYNVGEKPTVILYIYINRHAGTPEKHLFCLIFIFLLDLKKPRPFVQSFFDNMHVPRHPHAQNYIKTVCCALFLFCFFLFLVSLEIRCRLFRVFCTITVFSLNRELHRTFCPLPDSVFLPWWSRVEFLTRHMDFCFIFSPNEQCGGCAARLSLLLHFPCSANHERAELCVFSVYFLPIHSGHQVRWTYQPESHRRKVTQDFSSTFFLRCVP